MRTQTQIQRQTQRQTQIHAQTEDGEGHLDVAATYNNQGSVYDCMDQYDKALEAYSKSINIVKSRITCRENL